ncbi:pyridoxal 5'-phosphate synthase [Kitasatospora sp. GP82]|uniref:pyridoxine/pyridoxamine 5'-phosphate oxidase n=1 Tax=Kitasatospora sp. GP82 TaxID=3035089 RepID=UPI0024770C3C|nr:pyridoxal 5'-phosphate synthase [Kitasatospora sp. GP82]MDH6129907.1 pyridoxamine 5'-phosphate oxidase [Kitasatospora sp. GP82]
MTEHARAEEHGTLAELLLERPPMARELPGFATDRLPANPAELFGEWLTGAFHAGVLDPQVVTLSTVDTDGCPDARVLVLRGLDVPGAGWVFAADADSAKGRQLAARPGAAISVYWPLLGQQVRVRGVVEAASAEDSAVDFLDRSPWSRAASLVGHQSEPLSSLDAYDSAAREARQRLEADPKLVAPGHTVYTLRAREVEFWQGDASRRHVRVHYTRNEVGAAPSAWSRTLLWP